MTAPGAGGGKEPPSPRRYGTCSIRLHAFSAWIAAAAPTRRDANPGNHADRQRQCASPNALFRIPYQETSMKNLSIKASLVALMSAIIVVVAISSAIALQSIHSITASAEKVGNFWIERLLSSREVKSDFADMRLTLARLAMVNDEAEFKAEMQALDAAKTKLEASIVKYEAGVFSPTGRALITEIRMLAANYLADSAPYIAHVRNHDLEAARTAFTMDMKPLELAREICTAGISGVSA